MAKNQTQIDRRLERAERENHVQEALDRVRTKALGMQMAEDIGSVVEEARDALMDLGINQYRTHIDVWDKDRDGLTCWSCKGAARFTQSKASLAEHWNSAGIVHGPRPRGKRWQVVRFTRRQLGAELKRSIVGFESEGVRITNDPDAWIERESKNAPSPFYQYLFYFSSGLVGLGMDRELEKEDIAIARRVTETFDIAYKRFAELQVAEFRNRELLVEATLEKVRSAALAMQTTNDLGSVVEVTQDALRDLGIDPHRTTIFLEDQVSDKTDMWWSRREGHDHETISGDVMRETIPFREDLDEVREENAHWIVPSLTRREIRRLWQGWRRVAETIEGFHFGDQGRPQQWMRDRIADTPVPYFSHHFFLSSGEIRIELGREMSEGELTMCDRIAATFDFAYKRFLDLQEKERRARVAEVEAALEKVRSAALAMQTTEDIGPVVFETRNAMHSLGIRPYRIAIALLDEDQDTIRAFSSRESFPFSDTVGCLSARRRAGSALFDQTGLQDWVVMRWNRRQLASEMRRIVRGMQVQSPEKWLETVLKSSPVPYYQYGFYFSGGFFDFGMNRELSVEEVEVVLRVTATFDFAYKRFLDLQQKEQRAREAEVEAAIERIRSQALAMETSEDLPSVAATLYRETTTLYKSGTEVGISVIGIVNEEQDLVTQQTVLPEAGSTRWSDDDYICDDVHVQIEPFKLSKLRSIDAYWKKAYRASDGDAVFLSHSYKVDQTYQIVQKMVKLGLWTQKQSEEVEAHFNTVLDRADTVEMGHVQFKHGYLWTLTDVPYTDSQIEELKRIGDVFAFAYDRFLELDAKQKANRELAVEAALERVRGQALAMESEQDLTGVANALFDELSELEQDLRRLTVEVFEKERPSNRGWMAIKDAEGNRHSLLVPSHGFQAEEQLRFDTWVKGKESLLHQIRDKKHVAELRPVLRALLTKMDPDLAKRFKFPRGAAQDEQHYSLFNAYGSIHLVSLDELTDESISTAQRFADLFAFAYDRFLELDAKQKANRELAVEAGLERVRGLALAMEGFDDLKDVSLAIFAELNGLSFDLLRASVTGGGGNWITRQDGKDQPARGDFFGNDIKSFDPALREEALRIYPDWGEDGEESWKKSARESGETHCHWRLEKDALKARIEASRLLWPDQSKGTRLNEVEEHYSLFSGDRGYMVIGSRELSEEEIAIALRFADQFMFAYNRFLELDAKQKANRALLVEGALERVRSRSLAMEGTDELPTVAKTLFEEFEGLDLDPVYLSIAITDYDRNYQSFGITDKENLFTGGQTDPAVWKRREFRDIYEGQKTGAPCCHFSRTRNQMHQLYTYLAKHMPHIGVNAEVLESSLPDHVDAYTMFFKGGFLLLYSKTPLNEADLEIGLRFAQEFGFAYGRHLELSEKIRQNRALLVEGALERVRSRSLAMEGTDELGEVARTLFEEFNRVGLSVRQLSISVVEDDGDTLNWRAREDKGKQTVLAFRSTEVFREKFSGDTKAALEKGEPYLHTAWDKKLASRFRKHIERHEQRILDSGTDPEVVRVWKSIGSVLPLHTYNLFFPQGWLHVASKEAIPEEDIQIGLRFAEEFGFAYDRYCELAEKIRQNRELQVEASLERVRARAQGMQESEELSDVARVLRAELRHLDVSLTQVTLILTPDDDRVELWYPPAYGVDIRVISESRVDLIEHFTWSASLFSVEAGENAHYVLRGKELREWVDYYHEYLKSIGAKARRPSARSQAKSSMAVNVFGFDRGSLALGVSDEHAGNLGPDNEPRLTPEEKAVVRRFADVFGFAYGRHRELKLKEAQNRELTIQNALERVQARALGMQVSAELSEVAAVLRAELADLGLQMTDNVGISLFHDGDRLEIWLPPSRGLDMRVLKIDVNDVCKHLPWIASWTSPQSGANSRFEFSEDQWEAWHRYCLELLDGEYAKGITPSRREAAVHSFGFTDGALDLVLPTNQLELSDSDIDVAQRFADAFGLAFARFRELKEKEDQNRELTIQNALERVRAKAQGMQESDELAGVARTIYEEFKGLGHQVTSAVVQIWENIEDSETVFWAFNEDVRDAFGLTDAELDSRKPYRIPAGNADSIKWRRDEQRQGYVRRRHEGQKLLERRRWFASVCDFPDRFRKPFLEQAPPVEFGLRIFHQNGAISFESTEELQEEDLLVARRLTEAFDFAYGRFVELREKEAQNRELTIQNALERVRAKAQGMQESSEIKGVALALRDEFVELGHEVDSAIVSIPDEVAGTIELWFANAQTPAATEMGPGGSQRLDRRRQVYKRWRKGERSWSRSADRNWLAAETRRIHEQMGIPKAETRRRLATMVEEPYTDTVNFGPGWITLVTSQSFDDQETAVALRFADVFGGAYVRFKELKEKEDQNRELTIQNALERVRSRALGMQESRELSDVTRVMREELKEVGVPFQQVGLALQPDEEHVEIWFPPGFGLESRALRGAKDDLLDRFPWLAQAMGKPGSSMSYDFTRDDFRIWCDYYYDHFESIGAKIDRPSEEVLDRLQFGVKSYAFDRGTILLSQVEPDGELPDRWIAQEGTESRFDDVEDVAKRFAEVFGVAYSRHRELEQKEAQNRELTIQNAIERVRAQAQGMQESAEISGVTSMLFEEFEGLGYALTHSAIHLIDEENDSITYWITSSSSDRTLSGVPGAPVHVPLDTARSAGTLAVKARGETHHTLEFPTRRDVEGFYVGARVAITGSTKKEARAYVRERSLVRDYLAVHRVFHTHGMVAFGTSERWSDEDLAIAKRFTDVFDYAYARFQELKEKEDQNRELTIQNALERVRSRALGMQESNELSDVANVLRVELKGLDLPINQTTLSLDVDDEVMEVWLPPLYGLDVRVFRVPRRELEVLTPSLMERLSHLGPGDDLCHEYPESEATALDEYMLAQYDDPEIPKRARATDAKRTYPRTFHHAVFKGGVLNLILNYERLLERSGEIRLNDEEQQVARRFADTFEFAYSRFLELKEKEDQNRELTIQNAIERVRSRALGMQESDEIKDVAKQIFEEIEQFGLSPWCANIGVVDRDKDLLTNYFSHKGEGPLGNRSLSLAAQQTPYTIVDNPNPDTDYHVIEMSGKKLKQGVKTYLELLMSPGTTRVSPSLGPARTAYLENHPDSLVFHYAYFDGGFLLVGHHVAFSQDDIDLLRRLSRTFEFAYARFLELRQKEDQNRELTIQNALERVRAQAQGMQESEEVAQVVECIYDEFGGLGYDMKWCQIAAYDPDDEHVDIWHASDNTRLADREQWTPWQAQLARMHAQRSGRHLDPGIREAKERGDRYFIEELEWSGESGDRRIAWMKENAGFTFDPERIERMKSGGTTWEHSVFHTHGVVKFSLREQLSEDDLAVAIRFGEAFDFAYSRFRELQEKEEQAREADQRAAVDRVRAEATAMEKADDIADVVTALWDGLIGQNIEFAFLTMEVIEREADLLQAYAAMPHQNPVQTRLDEDRQELRQELILRENILEGVDLLRSEISLTEAVSTGFVTEGLSRTIIDTGSDRSAFIEKVWGIKTSADRPPVVKSLRAGFGQGSLNLYVDPDEDVPADTIAFVQALGEAVSLGFARYWDFRELEAQNRALEEANEQVREATRLKSQFLATMSHELRTPMNAIIGFTRLVRGRGADNLTERQMGNLEKVQLSADHLLNLINEILDLSKVEAGRVDIEAAEFALEPLLQGACNTVGPTLGKAGVQVNCEVASDVGEIYSDEARLRQVVINLLSNALKFTDEGSVTVTAGVGSGASGVGEHIIISVADTGIGIPEDQLETIFEEFRQVDGSSTRRHQGTGLGLAITKKLVELLGGQISVESVVGEGSTFTIVMPVRYGEAVSTTPDTPLPTPDVSEQSGERKAQSENGQSSRVIVSIDDDPNVAVLLRQELEDDGYTVISALNADEGVALVKKHQPAAVTVDILMPGKDGWETIGMLKADPETRGVPIIVVSGMDNRDLGTAMGVKDYLVKPVDRDALLKALEKVGSDVKHVLVVDDEASARDLLVQILGDEGMESRTAVNGREALEAIERQVPDAILLDLMMPEVDGFEVVQRLQENEAWKGIPVIVVTAKDLELEEKTFLSERVERVVQKGKMEPSELGKAVREAI
jgi:signal transduction histidine kinase/CheY-like chemotaxis protein